jgi:hypothetical protein
MLVFVVPSQWLNKRKAKKSHIAAIRLFAQFGLRGTKGFRFEWSSRSPLYSIGGPGQPNQVP